MSGRIRTEEARGDERRMRTRQALLEALIGAVRHGRYDRLEVSDLIAEAGVGRSTFYDHFRGKDDMIVQTMGHMLDALASVVDETRAARAAGEAHPVQGAQGAVRAVLAHFGENEPFARHMLVSAECAPLVGRITRELAARIEQRLAGRARRPAAPVALIAAQLAESQIAFVRAWLALGRPCGEDELARAMCLSAEGSLAALA